MHTGLIYRFPSIQEELTSSCRRHEEEKRIAAHIPLLLARRFATRREMEPQIHLRQFSHARHVRRDCLTREKNLFRRLSNNSANRLIGTHWHEKSEDHRV